MPHGSKITNRTNLVLFYSAAITGMDYKEYSLDEQNNSSDNKSYVTEEDES